MSSLIKPETKAVHGDLCRSDTPRDTCFCGYGDKDAQRDALEVNRNGHGDDESQYDYTFWDAWADHDMSCEILKEEEEKYALDYVGITQLQREGKL